MEKLNYEVFRDDLQIPYFKEVENNTCWLHFHRNMELLYVVDGVLNGTINDYPYKFSKDEIAFLPNYCHHTFSTTEYSKTIILIIPYDIGNDFQNIFTNSQFDFKLNDRRYNADILKILRLMQDNFGKESALINKGFINSIIGMLLHNYPLIDKKTPPHLNIIIDILNYIDNNYAKKLSLPILANVFGYNKDYFSKMFNNCVGSNLNTYINHIRIENALNIIRRSYDRNIADIALDCGFDSSATFYRVFKNLYNTTPLEYLKKLPSKTNL